MEKDHEIKKEGTTLYVRLGYELSTANAPALQEKLGEYRSQDIRKVVFDATELVYISSSGIRVVLFVQKKLTSHPEVVFVNCAKEIYETLELTGITNFISFVDDARKDNPTGGNEADDEWQQKMDDTRQKMLDHFAASNDLVMYQMKLGQTEE